MRHLVPDIPKPDYDRDVLIPLHQAQIAALAKKTADCKAAGGTLDAGVCIMPPPPPPAPVYVPLPSGNAKAFIYSSESGNDPTKWNTSGCLGLGQACPASKLLAVCPAMDYACEDAWFTNYMVSRYGTWENAMAFWQRTDPRPYPGHWW